MAPEEYTFVKRSLNRLLDVHLEYYKDEQMRRRLDAWLARSGRQSWPEYFRLARADAPELARLRDYLTINVSSFFRDPERWHELQTRLLPALLRSAPKRGLRVWSAGCSIGPEAYTLAMLLAEAAPLRPQYLLATDVDRGALAKAQARGPYSEQDLQNLTPERRARHFEPGGPPFFVRPALARRLTFAEQDLLADPFEDDFDLIVCRNVVIYFTAAAKEQLYRKFCAALRPGGVLFMGGTELIPRASDIGLAHCGSSFYYKYNP